MAEFNGSNEAYFCPITCQLMVDPVIDSDGNSYERAAIEEWLSRTGMSPITRNAMSAADLVSNRALKDAIDAERATLPSTAGSNRVPMDIEDALKFESAYPDLELQVTGMLASELDSTDDSGDALYLINMISPATLSRTPTDVVVCIDISGSMGSRASAAGVESSNLSMLDLVKHAVKTVAAVLDPSDRLAIVAWSSDSTVVTELTSMTDRGRSTANAKLDAIDVMGMTNIWDGLKTGLELLDARDDGIVGGVPANSRSGAVFLLTDGVPNVEPPRGFIPSLQRYRDQHGAKLPGIITTFGFGYNLQSQLLSDYAYEGAGAMAFIPDSGFVGTIFVNALANTLTTTVESAVLGVLSDQNGSVLESLSTEDVEGTFGDSITFKSKTVQNGQSSGCIVRVKASAGVMASPDKIEANIKYRFAGTSRNSEERNSVARGSGSLADTSEAQKQEIACEAFRLKAVNALKAALDNYNADRTTKENSAPITEVVDQIKSWLSNHQSVPAEKLAGELGQAPASAFTRVSDLLQDLEGQALEAVSKEEFFTKWGKHFLRSIRCAHQLKQCNNFKDPGVQHYGNKLFTELRDLADDAFSSLPAPVPKQSNAPSMGYTRSSGSPIAAVSMSSFNRSDMVCFHGDSLVLLEGGATKAAREVTAGDITADGGIVRCAVKTVIADGHCELVRLPSGLLLTLWHPVKVGGEWCFPAEIGVVEDVPCDAVYSYVVEKAPTTVSGDGAWPYQSEIVVDGTISATLAHGILGQDKISHPFFGTAAIVDALSRCEGWASGLVTFQSNAAHQTGFLLRESATSLVAGLDASRAVA